MLRKTLNRWLPEARPPICTDVAQWAIQRGIPVRELHAPVADEVKALLLQDPNGALAFAAHREDLERPQHLVCLEKTRVRGWSGIVILPDGTFCQQGQWGRAELTEQPGYKRRIPYESPYLPGNWFSLLSLWAREYCHWFSDVLPRLHLALPHLPPDTKFLINSSLCKYQLESLECYGIDRDRLREQSFTIDARPERLWFATPLGHTSATSGPVTREMTQKIRTALGLKNDHSAPTRRLWISRSAGHLRRIVNEAELLPLLTEHRFEICHLEKLSWRDQIVLLGEADWLIGAHGAGLMNVIFAVKATLLGEVYGDIPVEHFCYGVKARQLGMRYVDFAATSVPIESDPQAMTVDVPRFAAWLAELETARV